MKGNSYRKNITSLSIKSDDLSNNFQIGKSMILGPKFDIKKYINNINPQQYSAKKEKINLPPLFDNSYKRNKNEESSTIASDNLPIPRNNHFRIKSPSIVSTSISCKNNISIKKNKHSSNTFNTINNDNIKLNKNNSRKTYFETETNYGSLNINNVNDKLQNNEEKFSLMKRLKNIRKIDNLSHRDKSIKNIMNNKIAYDPKNLDVIYKPIKIINDYLHYKQSELNKNKDDISSFITESKEISKKNILIRNLTNQQNKYNNDLNERLKTLENNKRTLELCQNNLSNFQRSQKLACRKIDDLLTQLLIKKKSLIKETYILSSEIRIKEDERQKLLERIDELRIIAKFVTRVLETDLDIYKIKIIPEYSSEKLPDYESISKELYERFKFIFDERENRNIGQEGINILKQINHLNDSELYYEHFHKIEEDIINALKNKEVINREIVEIINEEKKQKNDILKRIKDLENELFLYKSIYEREKAEYDEIFKRTDTGEGEFDEVIKDLYYDVIEKNNKKPKKNILNINRAACEIKNAVVGKEIKINKLIAELETYEKEDLMLFTRAVHHRKNENKEMKINMMKMKITEGEKEKMEVYIPTEKIVIIGRKCEPPFHVKKKEKKIKIDPELIKDREDEELMIYK